MVQTWLIVNGEPLDMGADPIPITRQVQSLADFDAKLGSFTRSFTVPNTDKNRRLLENAFTFNAVSQFPYREANAKLVANGMELGVGTLIVENNGVTPNTIRLTYYLDASPFYQLANNLTLWECKLGRFDTFWNYANVYNGRKPTTASGLPVVYPILDYGNDPTKFGSTASSVDIPINRLYPAVYLKDVLTAVGDTIGYTFTGRVLESPLSLDGANADKLFSDIIWPYSRDGWKRDKNLSQRYTYTMENAGPITTGGAGGPISVPAYNGLGIPIGYRDDGGPLPIYGNQPNMQWPGQQYVADKVTLKFTISGTYNAGGLFTGPYCGIRINNGTHIQVAPKGHYYGRFIDANGVVLECTPIFNSFQGNGVYWFINQLVPGVYRFEFSGYFTNDLPHNNWQFWFQPMPSGSYQFTNINMRVEFMADAGTEESDRAIKLDYPDDPTIPGPYTAISKTWVPGYTIIPNWSVAKFIKGLAQLFGCFILVNERERTVRLFQLRELYENAGNPLDWSEKFVDGERVQWNTRASGFGQTSYIRFTNEDGVGTGPGQYVLPVDDTTLATQKDVITAPWGATVYAPRWTNYNQLGIPIGLIKRLDEDGDFSGPDGARLLHIVYNAPVGPTYNYRKPDGTLFTSGGAGNLPSAPNIPLTQFTGPAGSPITLGFDTAYQWHYRWLGYISERYKMVTVYFMLSGADIRDVDFTRPVYIRQLGGMFYIQKIKDWLPGKPVAIELIQM